MKHHEARRLFGAYWDDETTQAEREWLEAHFAGCDACRAEYEQFTRVIEAMGTLPRHEVAPDLLERTLARTRRMTPARDVLPERRPMWVPVTAAAVATLLVVGAVAGLIGHGFLGGPGADRVATRSAATVRQVASAVPAPVRRTTLVAGGSLAAVPDSIFDHSDDVEFVLDPVTLKRGRASVTRALPGGIRTEQAVVSF